VPNELIGMLCLYAKAGKGVWWKVPQIEGDDDTRLTSNGSREHMTIIGVGKLQALNEFFKACHQTIRDRLVHQLSGSLELGCCNILSMGQYATNPLIMDAVGPARTEKLCHGQAQQKISKWRWIEHTGVIERSEIRHPQ